MHNQRMVVIDVGNSRIKLGLVEFTKAELLPECLGISALDIDQSQPTEQLAQWVRSFLEQHQLGEVVAILAGSNLQGVEALKQVWPDERCKLVVKQDRETFPLPILVDFPEKVGMDRLLNALAIKHVKPADHLAVIVDTGTATTVDVVSQQGEFLGGAILPGLRLSALSLHHYTSQLPYVDVNLLTQAPLRVIGKNTHEAILNGILWGHLGAIHDLVQRYAACCAGPVSCYLTGGAAPLLHPHLKQDFLHFPHLPLQGLALWGE